MRILPYARFTLASAGVKFPVSLLAKSGAPGAAPQSSGCSGTMNRSGSRAVRFAREARLPSSLAKKQRNNRNRRRAGMSARNGTQFPSQISTSIQVDKVVRFQASAALSGVTITTTDIFDLLCVAATTTSAYQLPVSMRFRKIEAWAPPASTGAATVLSVEDSAPGLGIGAPSRVREDTTMGTNRPAHVVWTPSGDSALSKWIDRSASSNLLKLTAPSGTTFDVHLSWMLQDGESPQSVTAAVAAATVGRLYIRALNSTGGNNIPPVSFPTI